jgi:hypothetical protein
MKKSSFYLAALAAVAVAAPLSAQTVSAVAGNVSVTDGPIQSAVQVRFMTGLKVTASWGGFQQTYTLGQIGATNIYGFTGADLELGLHGWSDTYYGAWTLDNRRGESLTRLLFETDGSNVMFDRSVGLLGLGEGTQGSDVGYDYNSGTCTFLGLVLCDIGGHVEYRDAVALGAAVHERLGGAARLHGLNIARVCGEDRLGLVAHRLRGRAQRRVLALGRGELELRGGRARARAEAFHGLGEVGRGGGAQCGHGPENSPPTAEKHGRTRTCTDEGRP